MAFPGTYNFNYYKGDTLEFKVYPKTSNGTAFDLTTYSLANDPAGDGAAFTIAVARGELGVTAGQIQATADISLADGSITCTISPTAGNQLDPNTRYVYDVEISKGSGSTVFTLLTGSITVTDQVTGA